MNKERARIAELAEKYIGTPPDQWPEITFNWDLRRESQRFSLDGCSEADFVRYHPEGFRLGWARLAEIDAHLHKFSYRAPSELWEVGCENKLARMVVYLSEKRPISPPLVHPNGYGQLVFQGGHHRYAIAKALNEEFVPIHVAPEKVAQVDALIQVGWV